MDNIYTFRSTSTNYYQLN